MSGRGAAWVAAGLVICAALGVHADTPPEPVLRIGLLKDVRQAIISSDGPIRVWRRGTGLRGSTLPAGVRLRVAATQMSHASWAASEGAGTSPNSGVVVSIVRQGRLGVFAEELILKPLSPNKPIRVEGKTYRGEVLVRAAGPQILTIINALGIEDYLRGVVPPEVGRSPDIPLATLQAQAIAARSYSLYYLGRHEDEGFDLMASPVDQVYGGMEVENEQADRAIHATRGVVATYHGKPIRANYCSTCGGRTEASARVWPGQIFPYLRGIRDRDGGGEDLCASSPHHHWEASWDAAQFEVSILKHLGEELPEARGVSEVRSMNVLSRTPSKRVDVLEICTDVGDFRIKGDRARWVLRRADGKPLRSTLFGKLRREGDRMILEGAGYGHGVGLCQVGAIEMGRRGRSAAQILKHYYYGIKLKKWW